jgi:hypothetical protein
MYVFENDVHFYRRFNILLNNSDILDWVSIPPFSSHTLELELRTMGPEILDLEVTLFVKDGEQYQLKITGEVEQAEAKLSQTYIPTKQIFQGKVYDSSKLLPKELTVDNPGNLPIRYQIEVPKIEECLITIIQVGGVVEPRTKHRIDMQL